MPDTAERKRITRLLIVEDDASQRYTLTDIMREEGFDVVGCPTAAEALEQIEICDFAVAIVDQRLPDLSGTGLLEKIRERNSHLRVIIHTGYGSFDSAKKAVNLGAFAYVEKLRDPTELIAYVHRALRERLTRYADDLETEIAERKRAEGENKRLATALECAGEGIIITDTEGVIQYVNPAFTSVTGYTSKEAIGQTPRILKSGKHPREFYAQMWRSVRRGEVWTGEIVNRRKDGTFYDAYLTVAPVADAEGNLEGFVAVQRDLTDRKQSEAALRSILEGTSAATGDDFFQLLVEHLATALGARHAMIGAVVDVTVQRLRPLAFWSDGRHVECADYTLEGTPCEAVIGREPCYYPSGVQSAFPDDLMLAEMGIESYLGTPLLDSDESPLGVLAVMHDQPLADAAHAMSVLTIFAARAGAELARERALNRARQREEELAHVARLSVMGEMATGIAHELNQPLSAIMNFTSACTRMVELGDASSADLLRNLERVSSLTTRSGEIIRRIRDFVRKRRPSRSTVNINEVIREVVALLSAGGRVGCAELRLELADDLPLVYADSVQLQQVLLNLVRNAAEAMEETPADNDVLTVRSEAPDAHWVEVTVRDTGPGLDPGIRDRLFEAYATTKKEGLGMGLPISRSIIEAHGGRLVVEPGKGGGVTFRFRVPLAEEESTK